MTAIYVLIAVVAVGAIATLLSYNRFVNQRQLWSCAAARL